MVFIVYFKSDKQSSSAPSRFHLHSARFFDRHNGNWGILVDTQGNSHIAPVYDCGSCLLPQADERVMKDILADENELNVRIYQFPTSAIKKNDQKINYFDFLSHCDNENCKVAIKRIYESIKLKEIYAFINLLQ